MTEEELEGPISFWGYKEQESKLILPEHDDDDDDDRGWMVWRMQGLRFVAVLMIPVFHNMTPFWMVNS